MTEEDLKLLEREVIRLGTENELLKQILQQLLKIELLPKSDG